MCIDRVKEALSEHLETVGNEDDVEEATACRPVEVFKAISRVDFATWLEKHEGQLRRWQYEPLTADTGRVVVYSFPTQAHTATAGHITYDVISQVDAIAGARFGSDLAVMASPTCDVGDRGQEPDGGLKPKTAARGASPTLIVEVAYKNESWGLLKQKLARWMRPTTNVQVAIGVKIYATRRRVIVYQRDDVRQEQYFAAGQPGSVSFPLRMLYQGAALPDTLIGHEDDLIQIDLAELGRTIDRWA